MTIRTQMLLVCPLSAMALLAQPGLQQTISHEGVNWIRTTTGNFPCAIQGRAKLSVAGDLTVRGQARSDCYFRIKQRVVAGNEDRARQLMHDFRIQAGSQGDASFFSVIPSTFGFACGVISLIICLKESICRRRQSSKPSR